MAKSKSSFRMLGVYLGHPFSTPFVSGGERRFLEVCRRLKATGYETCVLTTITGEEALEQNSVDVDKYVVSPFLENILNKSLVLFFLVRIFRSFFFSLRLKDSFNVVISSSHFIFDLLPAVVVAKRNKGSKLMVYLHHIEPPPFQRAKYHQFLPSFFEWISQIICIRLIVSYADTVFINPLDRQSIERLGVSEEKISVMYQGIELARIRNIEKCKKRSYDACFLGRLSPPKGIFDLVDVWKIVQRKLPNVQIAIIGGGMENYVAQLKEKIKANKLEDNMLLLGVLDENAKYGCIKASKVFIFPSYEEGWGIAVCEAMACGLPVIVYDLPAYRIFGDAILRVPRGDKVMLAQKMFQLLSEENLSAEMGEKAKKVANVFDWDTVLQEDIKVLGEHNAH